MGAHERKDLTHFRGQAFRNTLAGGSEKEAYMQNESLATDIEPSEPVEASSVIPLPIPPPDIPDLSRASAFMPAEDARRLRGYFRGGSGSMLQASNWGAQLDRLYLNSGGSLPCEACGGSIADGRVGCGFQPIARPKKKKTKADELLAIVMDDPALANLEAEMPRMSGHYCPHCGGRGVTPLRSQTRPTGPITARPTGSSKHGSVPSTSLGDDLVAVGWVLRGMTAIKGVWPGAIDVLEAHLGPDADGTLFPIYPLTPAAKKLLRKNPHGLTPLKLLANEYTAAIEHQDATKKAIFATAETQARELRERATRAWNWAVHGDSDELFVAERALTLLDGGALQ
jgi:hypothetical protein